MYSIENNSNNMKTIGEPKLEHKSMLQIPGIILPSGLYGEQNFVMPFANIYHSSWQRNMMLMN